MSPKRKGKTTWKHVIAARKLRQEETEADEERTKFLNDHSLRVIRFRNEEILKSLPVVLQKIVEITSGPSSLP